MTRVLHVWQSHYPWDVRVAKINRTFRDHGISVVTLARHRQNEAKEAEFEGTRIVRLGAGLPRALSLPVPMNMLWTRAIEHESHRIGADVILVRDLPLASAALSAAKTMKIPAILDMAEHYPEAMRTWKKYSSNFLSRLAVHTLRLPDRLERAVCARFDQIWVVCEEQKERLVKDYGIDAAKIILVLNTPEDVGPAQAAVSRPRTCFGYHGLLCDDRELEVVFKGFDIAAEKNPDITLLIAGGGESERDLRQLRAKLRHKDRVEMTGRYEPQALASLYDRADFGIVSLRKNLFTEHTLANKFFDYAGRGKPFLFTDIAPLRRVMNQMKAGVGFQAGNPASFAEAVDTLRAQNYEELAQNGIRSVQTEFNWKSDAARMLESIERVTGGKRK